MGHGIASKRLAIDTTPFHARGHSGNVWGFLLYGVGGASVEFTSNGTYRFSTYVFDKNGERDEEIDRGSFYSLEDAEAAARAELKRRYKPWRYR